VASTGGPLERDLAAAGCTPLRLPREGAFQLGAWRTGRLLDTAIREHGISIVHAHDAATAPRAAAAARRCGIRLVATAHEPQPQPEQAERVIAVSDHVAEQLGARHRIGPERLRVVRRAVDPDEFDPERVRGHRVQALAERWRVADGERVVLVPPLHAEDQGHRLLVQALARLPRVDFVAVFLGPIPAATGYANALVAAVRRAGLGERVRFAGATDDLPAALGLADIVVVPATRPDPSGTMAVAAQTMGRPVIVTNCGALGEAVMPAATGWLVPEGDAAELARALDLALGMAPEIRQRLATRARAFVRSEFDPVLLGDRLLAVYGELLTPRVAQGG
jgi:glycosyltransferase involved in cell wall biosynthesis